jgi:hypothetical protein
MALSRRSFSLLLRIGLSEYRDGWLQPGHVLLGLMLQYSLRSGGNAPSHAQ